MFNIFQTKKYLIISPIVLAIYIFNVGIWPDYRVNSYDQLNQLDSFLYLFDSDLYSQFDESSLSRFSLTGYLLKFLNYLFDLNFYILIFLITTATHLLLIISIILLIDLFVKNIVFSSILCILMFYSIDWNWSLFFSNEP